SSSPRFLLLSAVAIAAVVGLAGCVQPVPDPVEPTTAPTPGPTATDAPTVAPTEEPHPLGLSCEELVDPDAVYAFDPTFALIGAYSPDAGTPAAAALEAGGVACRLIRESG